MKARTNPYSFNGYVMEDEKTGMPWKQCEMHREWQIGITEHHRILYLAPREHGKCVCDDQLITLNDGRRIKAVDLPEDFEVVAWTEEKGWHYAKARKWRQSVQKVVKITTDTGREARVSLEHPFWTTKGWVSVGALVKGQEVATSRLRENVLLSWERITKIEYEGEERTWSIEVDGSHTHLVNDFVTHNSSQITVGRTLYEIGKNTDVRIKIVAQSDDMAWAKLGLVQEYIEKNERYHEVFPNVRPALRGEWSKSKLFVERSVFSKDPSIEAKGILSAATGGRVDIIIFDDPVDFRNAIENPAMRPKVKQAFRSVWMNLLPASGGKAIYICTVWHEDDLTHELKREKQWHMKEWNIGENFEPVWPARWGVVQLKSRYIDIGPREFDRGFRNRAMTDKEATFPSRMVDEQVKMIGVSPGDVNKKWPAFTGVDLAIGKKDDAAFNVVFTLRFDVETMTKWVIDIRRGKWTSPETANEILDAWRTHDSQIIEVENNVYQEAIIQWMQANDDYPNGLPLEGFTTGKQKADMLIGLPGMSAEMANDGWKVPMGPTEHHATCGCNFCEFLRELKAHPVGKFSDTIMAGWMASNAARKVSATKVSTEQISGGAKAGQGIADYLKPKGRGRLTGRR